MTFLLILGALFAPLLLMLLAGQWQSGMLYTIAIGFLQDPIRKLAPGQPAAYSALVLLAFLLTSILLITKKRGLDVFKPFKGGPGLIKIINYSLFVLAAQSVQSFLRFGSAKLTLLGLVFYLSPLLALWGGFHLGLSPGKPSLWLKYYIIFVSIFTISLLINFVGWESVLTQEVGGGIEINLSQAGLMIQGFSGLWRTSEIAAWHMAAGSCLLVVLATTTRKPWLILLAVFVAIIILLLATLTGRRKALGLAAVFAIMFPLVIQLTKRRGTNIAILQSMIGAVGVILLISLIGVDLRDWLGPIGLGFLDRASTTAMDSGGRFQDLGIGSLGWAVTRAGWLGLGVGAGAQGAQYLNVAAASASVGGAAEAGSGKLLIELGLPGLFLVITFACLLAKYFFAICCVVMARGSRYGILICGLASFLAANIPVFFVASQIYGDPFILLILGTLTGLILAAPQVLASQNNLLPRLAVDQTI